MPTKTTNLRPLHDRLIVRRSEKKDQTAGGIYIPDNAKEKPIEGKVLAVGPGAVLECGKLRETTVRVGETVMFEKHRGTEVRIGEEDLLVLREGDVLGVVGA